MRRRLTSARSAWRSLSELVRGSRREVAIGVALAMVQVGLLLPIASLIRHLFDVDVPRDNSEGILLSGLLVIAFYGASATVAAIGQAYAARGAKTAMARVRRDLISTLEALPLSWHDRHDAGALHAVVVNDCERVDRMIISIVSQALPAAVAICALAGAAIIIDPVLFLVTLVFVPLMLFSSRWFSRTFMRRLTIWHRTAESLSSHTQVMLRGLATIRAAGAEQRDRARFEHEIDEFTDAGYRAAAARSRSQAAHGAIAAVAGVCVLITGGLLVAAHHLTQGGLLAFYAIVALMLRQTSTAQTAGPLIVEGTLALRRVLELAAATEPDAYDGTRRIAFQGEITLESVTFRYDKDGGGQPAVQGISLRIEPGEHISLVGPSGAGKTTLMALMLGLYRPQDGIVSADGVALDELDLTDLRAQVGVILQDSVLFRGTIRENLMLAAPFADDAAINEALDAALVRGVIEELPAGVDTELGDDGGGMSGGERQRIAVARSILSRPALVMLDEPTAHLPAEMSARLIDNILARPWRPAVLVITHDHAIAARANRVIQMRAGQVVEDAVPA